MSDARPAPRVRRLDDALIDQIAAGEVIERPASIVKELVENALDADARRIRVEVRGGGRDFISVSDDGVGMSPEDAQLALERHATSKLRSADDLTDIGSYGFRGEALPAIASVSRLSLRTRPRGADVGFEIVVEGGEVRSAQPAGAAEGTRIEVADLFASVPARRKFLKTEATEWGHAADWLARAALALPDVHFDLVRDGRPAGAWPVAASLQDRAAAVLGEKEAAALVPVDRAEGRVRVHGLVSRPDHHRGTTAGIRFYVNRRSIRDRTLQHALLDVYRDWLPRGRFPSALLFLELPGAAVDVNVHPAKWEVRFADPRGLHRLVRDAVREAVGRRSWVASGAAPTAGTATHATATPAAPAGSWRGGAPAPTAATSDWILAERAQPAAGAPGEPPTERIRFGDLRLLGQLLATYLLLEGKEQLLLVDQHAAHERVLYERLRAQWIENGVERQGLLAPLAVELEPRAFAALVEQRETLEKLGFEVDAFGEQTFAVRAVPALLADRDPAALLRSLGDELVAGGGALAPESAVRSLTPADRLFATLACHSARRKGDLLDPREQRALIDALDAIPWAPTCPHGRPVAVPFEQAEIERRFGRR
ncbi:MAG: DNA mismatch repair endonuclease MutL [Myxococcota bacterium]